MPIMKLGITKKRKGTMPLFFKKSIQQKMVVHYIIALTGFASSALKAGDLDIAKRK